MWTKLAHIVLKNRLALIILIGCVTVFMGYHARKVSFTYSLFTPVPPEDPDMMFFSQFKEEFGEDANIVALGIKDSSLYTPQNFRRFKYLSDELKLIDGVIQVVSIPLFKALVKDVQNKRFVAEPIFTDVPDDQKALDSLLQKAKDQKFFSDQIINLENGRLSS
jgi:predicted RND superfamily exporter protein